MKRALAVTAAVWLGGCIDLTLPNISTEPVAVAGGLPFLSLSAGTLHTCGISMTGLTYCWGWNSNGQLGDGSTTDHASPVPVFGSLMFQGVDAGAGHTCGVATDGAAYCWGFNFRGQVGDGSTVTPRLTPVTVSGGITFDAVAAGGGYSCGVGSDSTAWCWGSGAGGQRGDGTLSDADAPVAVAGGLRFVAVAVGSLHSCGLTADSTAYCWGRNDSGQLGNDSQADESLPVAVSGGLKLTSVTVGGAHSCGITAVGDAYCWGANSVVQLGDTLVGMALAPTLVGGENTFRTISAGGSHTCGITVGDEARCWGANSSGQLGAPATHTCFFSSGGQSPCSPLPQPVSGGYTFTSISAGNQHTCALTTDQRAYCWGLNDNGQLGRGGTAAAVAPVPVRAISPARRL
jgi:alpha-tubulin suppressor-like RCC1 family protein